MFQVLIGIYMCFAFTGVRYFKVCYRKIFIFILFSHIALVRLIQSKHAKILPHHCVSGPPV